MALSDTAIVVLGALFLAAVCAAVIYIIRGTVNRRSQPKEKPYIWKPEQDYDVVYSDEGPMTPPFPTLKKRKRR